MACRAPAVPRAELLRHVEQQLGSSREARWVVEEVLGTATGATREQAGEIEAIVARRRSGEPLQYVVGHWPFRGLELRVDRRALIPRPETEELVDVARRSTGRTNVRVVADLGTGSGALALALAAELGTGRPGLEVWAVDDDAGALALAEANLAELERRDEVPRGVVRFRRGDWWEGLPSTRRGRVDLVVANPPYVSDGEWASLDRSVADHEPRHALVAADGPDGTPGLGGVAAVVAGLPSWLSERGVAVIELAPPQAEPARRLALGCGCRRSDVVPDLSGRSRFLVAGNVPAGTAV